MNRRRVVVTGMGAVSPLGLSVSETWEGILACKSGVGLIQTFDTTDYPVKIAAQVKNFDPTCCMEPKEVRKTTDFLQFAMAAAAEAVRDANWETPPALAPRVGVAVGSGIGGLNWIERGVETIEKFGPRKLSPFFIPGAIINMAAGAVSIKYNCKGPSIAIVTACTTGAHNIGYAARIIERGDADMMICGGAEMATSPLGVGGFAAARALSRRNEDPESASRPWDKDRDGFVLGEGAAILVLEELEFAKRRGARIYAELRGFGASADAYHATLPDALGMQAAMANAIRDAGISPAQVQYLNAHATSTIAGDTTEVEAIKAIFGKHAYQMAVSSTKSMIGHLLGAAGAIEAIFAILAIRDQVAPPTANLVQPDEGCDLDFVPNKARKMTIEHAISNSFGFGGTNGCLLFSRFSE